MEANLKLRNVRVYNIVKFDIAINEDCRVELVDNDRTIRWFSDNDQVLSVEVEDRGESAKIKPTAKGKCDLQLQSNGEIIMTLEVEVFDETATTLNPVAGAPMLKQN